MRHQLLSTLGLGALLVACAHRSNAGTPAAESAAEARIERTSEARAEATPEADVEKGAPSKLDLPPREPNRRLAAAGGDVPVASNDAQADNSGINERDRDHANLTPLDQGNSELDIDLTQRIRKTVMGDDSLSFTAKNVKIITRDGHVTLRGPVNTAEEREAIGKAAAMRAGAAHVTNELEIKH